MLRTFSFVVDVGGNVAPHAVQTGPGGLVLPARMAFIETRFPRENTFDEVIDPAQIRRSIGYGLAWPNPSSVAAMLDALPPARGSVAPRATGGGGRGRGR